jgi:thiamine biosynthesis lipoprotein
MATIFEIFISHKDVKYAAQAAFAAFAEIDRLELELSRYIANSDISRINRLRNNEVITIGIDTFTCLEECKKLYEETNGKFDISIGPLIDFWRHKGQYQDVDFESKLKIIREQVGLHNLILIPDQYQIGISEGTIKLDLGGYGKGYAVDKVAEILLEWDIERAFIHGGRSTVLALQSPHGKSAWQVSISNPQNPALMIDKINLNYNSLSGSGLQKGAHIINPETGIPVRDKLAVWSLAKSAVMSDALSTTFMIMSLQEIEAYLAAHRDISAKILLPASADRSMEFSLLSLGSW